MVVAAEKEEPTNPQVATDIDQNSNNPSPSPAVLRFILVVGLLFLIIGSILLTLLLLRSYCDKHRPNEDKSHTSTDEEEGSDADEVVGGRGNLHGGAPVLSDKEAELELQHQSSLRNTIHRVLSGRSHDANRLDEDEHSVRSGVDIIYGEDEEDEIVSSPTVFELNSDLQWQAWEEFESSHRTSDRTALEDNALVQTKNEPLFSRSEL